MVGLRSASAGRTVYGSGSFAPTKGRVSANGMQGYINRQIRQGGVRRQGGDGFSDTRSGLAANAIQRRQQFQNQGRNPNQGRTPFNNEGRNPNAQLGQGGRQFFNNEGRRNPGAAGNAPGPAAGGNSGPPSVVINANGQLELPYSPAWSQALLAQMGQYNNSLLDLQTQQAQSALDYTKEVDATKTGYKNQQRGTLNNAGGSGTLFSTAYGTAAANDAQNFNNTINQLLSDHQSQQGAFDAERTSIINAFKQQMQQQALAYAEEMSAQAGGLGYGQNKPPKHPGQNTSAYGPRGPKGPKGGKGKPGKGKGNR